MRRREVIAGLGSVPLLPVLWGQAQQPAMPVIGFLGGTSPDPYADRLRAFRQGLSETGYVEGRNVAIEYRWAEGHFDRLPALVANLVGRQVAVIAMAGSTSGGTRGTGTIPTVFSIAGDPVQLGLVANLNRPGGNLTGMTIWNAELVPKRLELLRPSPYGDEQTRPARLLRRKRQDMRRRYRALSGCNCMS